MFLTSSQLRYFMTFGRQVSPATPPHTLFVSGGRAVATLAIVFLSVPTCLFNGEIASS